MDGVDLPGESSETYLSLEYRIGAIFCKEIQKEVVKEAKGHIHAARG
jgi:hypothetical protein